MMIVKSQWDREIAIFFSIHTYIHTYIDGLNNTYVDVRVIHRHMCVKLVKLYRGTYLLA